MSSRYGYRVGSYSWKVDADTTMSELERIKKLTGEISPDVVLDEAKNEDNPIHDNFEWDDSVAGYKFRKQQVRQLLGDFIQITEEVRERIEDEFVIITEEIRTREDKVFYSIKTGEDEDKKHPREYVTATEIKVNDSLHQQTIEKFNSDLKTLVKRYEQFEFMKDKIELLESLL